MKFIIKNRLLHYSFCLFFVLLLGSSQAQNLEALLEKESENEKIPVTATFKSTRIINLHSIKTTGKGVLDFRIFHRFGQIDEGAYDLFGLDDASIRLGLEMGITDDLMIGFGRSSFQKTYDGFVKYKILKQTLGESAFPLSLTGLASMTLNTLRYSDRQEQIGYNFTHRLSYTYQAHIARKFGDILALQFSPGIVYRNLAQTAEDENLIYSLGTGGRIQITPGWHFTFEYILVPEGQIESDFQGEEVQNSVSIGCDIETGGHVFQLYLTNSTGMVEPAFIGQTTGDITEGGIHFGFSISRAFQIYN